MTSPQARALNWSIAPVTLAAADGGQLEVNTDPVVERAGGAAPHPDVSEAQPMEVSLEQRVTTGATKRAAETQLTPNSVDGHIGDLRSFDGQDSPSETIDEDSRRYDYFSGEVLDRIKYINYWSKERT